MTTGIMGAMPEEINALRNQMEIAETVQLGQREYHRGRLFGQEVVVVFSRWGKVAAATTATVLLERFGIDRLLFTGVAGSLNENVRIGDIVLATRLCHHDLDARPFMPRYEVPLLGCNWFSTDSPWLQQAAERLKPFFGLSGKLVRDYRDLLQLHNIHNPILHLADIGSGDQVISRPEQRQEIIRQLPSLACVEMEGASVAQVCFEHQVPCLVMRTISDAANEHTAIDFPGFIEDIAGLYASCLVKSLLNQQ